MNGAGVILLSLFAGHAGPAVPAGPARDPAAARPLPPARGPRLRQGPAAPRPSPARPPARRPRGPVGELPGTHDIQMSKPDRVEVTGGAHARARQRLRRRCCTCAAISTPAPAPACARMPTSWATPRCRPTCDLRTLACDGEVRLGAGARVHRWLDADRDVWAAEGCDLGAYCATAGALHLADGVRFTRLFAEPILTPGAPAAAAAGRFPPTLPPLPRPERPRNELTASIDEALAWHRGRPEPRRRVAPGGRRRGPRRPAPRARRGRCAAGSASTATAAWRRGACSTATSTPTATSCSATSVTVTGTIFTQARVTIGRGVPDRPARRREIGRRQPRRDPRSRGGRPRSGACRDARGACRAATAPDPGRRRRPGLRDARPVLGAELHGPGGRRADPGAGGAQSPP